MNSRLITTVSPVETKTGSTISWSSHFGKCARFMGVASMFCLLGLPLSGQDKPLKKAASKKALKKTETISTPLQSGIKPKAEDGRVLNLDFEKAT